MFIQECLFQVLLKIVLYNICCVFCEYINVCEHVPLTLAPATSIPSQYSVITQVVDTILECVVLYGWRKHYKHHGSDHNWLKIHSIRTVK